MHARTHTSKYGHTINTWVTFILVALYTVLAQVQRNLRSLFCHSKLHIDDARAQVFESDIIDEENVSK